MEKKLNFEDMFMLKQNVSSHHVITFLVSEVWHTKILNNDFAEKGSIEVRTKSLNTLY